MGPIQSSINTALGVAALASGLTNKKQVEKAQDKLDKSEENLAKKEEVLAKTTEEKNKAEQEIKDINDEEIKQKMYTGGNTFNVSKDIPTAKETNAANTAGDKSVDINSINSNNLGSSINDYLKYSNQKVDPILQEQIMGFHALKMLDSRIEAKRAVEERIKSRRTMISDRTRAALEARAKNGGNK